MNEKTASYAVIGIGVAILLGSVLADIIGLGDDEGFGRQQIIGAFAGAVVTGIGVFLMTRKNK